MKRIILLFALFYSLTFGQGWNNTVTTSISESNLDKMDVFTNKDGNHLLIKRTNGNIVYYNFNSSGTVDGNKTATLESNGDFPNIVGSNDKIFALYKAGNYIKGKYSTNGGSSWSSLPYNISTSTNACNGVDAVYDKDRGIHLVFAMRDTYMYFETYYYRLNSSNQWVDSKNVTDYGSEVGGVPSVTFSDNRIHVSYNTGEADPPYIGVGESKTRDKNLSTSTWLTPQLVSDGEVDYGTSREKLRVRGNKLFCIFLDCWADLGQYGYHVQVKTRDLTGTYWPGSYTQIFYDGSPQLFLGAETTANSNLNVVNIAWDGLKHIYYDGSDWSDEYTITTDVLNYENQHLAFAVTSNDLFVLWKPLSGNYVKYRQYDAAPLTPANFSGTTYNNHPKITWTLNNEPDITGYEVYRNITGSYVLLGTVSASTSYFVDDEVGLGGSVEGMVFYKIRAKDNHPNYSNYTGTVSYRYHDYNPNKKGNAVEVFDYKLNSNFPNPFNPSTEITYSLAQSAEVTLIVYDILGTQVAELVNETQSGGNHSITFNSNNLSSGVYVYRIVASKNGNLLFTDTKQMILLR